MQQRITEMQHIQAVTVRAVFSVPVCRRAAIVGPRTISSPKLDSQFLQGGLPLICNGLSPLQNISEFLQFHQSVGQLPPHQL